MSEKNEIEALTDAMERVTEILETLIVVGAGESIPAGMYKNLMIKVDLIRINLTSLP